ncbi:MAG: hypothetical protein PHH73_00125 [Candidatus Rickettsiella isopodorum]|nr:hypothetical protein [Candidatus Rickettsiella isopodorum]
MVKKIFNVLVIIALVIFTSGLSYTATVKSDDANKPMSNNFGAFENVDLVGVDAHVVRQTTTGQVCKNDSVTTSVSTNTSNPCLLYGIVVTTTNAEGYVCGTNYIVIRDTFVVNTTQEPTFVIMFSSASDTVAGSIHGQRYTWTPPAPIKFRHGILATNSGTGFNTTVLFRYLKR